jgi:hypothetical protein
MPDELIGEHDNWQKGGHKATSADRVRGLLRETRPLCIEGRIPESLATYDCANYGFNEGPGPQWFAFAHLDLDLHFSTLEALKFIWKRLVPGAWLVCHNYNDKGSIRTKGVRQAFDDMFGTVAESEFPRIEISDTQVMMVKA